MSLPAERVSPYVRALIASLDALAPNEDHVPLAEAVGHLQAIDPSMGGALLAPVEISELSGMPAYTWLERARAEAVLARRGDDTKDPSDAEIERAMGLDPDLGRRQRARRDLRRHLRRAPLLPSTRLVGAVRRVAPVEVALAYDRMAPDGRWLRIRAELRLAGTANGLRVSTGGVLTLEHAVQHLFTRHFSVRLDALLATLAEATGCEVRRLSRGWLGPFWYPGLAQDPTVPEVLYSGLLLHGSTEVIGADVVGDHHLDPYEDQPVGEQIPEGFGRFRERRFAATGRVVEPARRWAESKGFKNVVVPVGGRGRRL